MHAPYWKKDPNTCVRIQTLREAMTDEIVALKERLNASGSSGSCILAPAGCLMPAVQLASAVLRKDLQEATNVATQMQSHYTAGPLIKRHMDIAELSDSEN